MQQRGPVVVGDEASSREIRRSRFPGFSELDWYGRLGLASVAAQLAVIAGLTVGVVLWRRWWVDAPYHGAWLTSLAQDPTNPTDPFSEQPTVSPFVSPYMLAWAWFMRLSGLDVAQTFSVMQFVNAAAWVAAVVWIVRGLSPERRSAWIPPACVAATSLTLWGIEPLKWPSYLSPAGASFMWPFPASFGLIGVLVLWGFWVRGKGEGLVAGLVVAVVAGLQLASHPYSALAAWSGFVGLAALAVVRREPLVPWVQRGGWGLLGIALAYAWPYSDLALLVRFADRFDEINLELGPLLPLAMVFALLGVPALFASRRRSWFAPLVAMATAGVVATAVSVLVTGSIFRLALATVVTLQIAAGLFLADTIRDVDRTRAKAVLAGVISLAMWTSLLASGRSLALALPDSILPGDGDYTHFVAASDPCSDAIVARDPGATIATPDKLYEWSAGYAPLPMATRHYPELDDPDYETEEQLRQALISTSDRATLMPLLDGLDVSYVVQLNPAHESMADLRVALPGCESYYVYRVG